MTADFDLARDLEAALKANGTVPHCDACETIASVSEGVRPALSSAMAGTIGRDKLAKILAANGHTVGRRAIERHQREAHTLRDQR